jgi:predicted nuclease of predicted toxin-antitoxin system
MRYRLLLDENVEHEVFHRLRNYGHDVEHVDFISELGKGTDDHPIAQYSRETDRIIVTYDDDFVLEIDEAEYRGVFYVTDSAISVKRVADIVHAVSQEYPQSEIHGLEYLGDSWL